MISLNFKGILALTILTTIVIELILVKTKLDNIAILGITYITSIILFNVYSRIKIKKKSSVDTDQVH